MQVEVCLAFGVAWKEQNGISNLGSVRYTDRRVHNDRIKHDMFRTPIMMGMAQTESQSDFFAVPARSDRRRHHHACLVA